MSRVGATGRKLGFIFRSIKEFLWARFSLQGAYLYEKQKNLKEINYHLGLSYLHKIQLCL